MDFAFSPIRQWPKAPTKYRTSSTFRSGYPQTIELLKRELSKINAKNCVIELYCRDSEIRQDGLPLATAKPSQPGVIVKFENRHGRFSYPCDKYTSWADNLRAIALTLEALRAIDRYGATYDGEQYKGWTALPTDTNADPLVKAASLIVTTAGNGYQVSDLLSNRDTLESAFRAAMLKAHPDRGGNVETAQSLNLARDTIKQAKGWN